MKGLRKKKVGHPILCEYIGGSSIDDIFYFLFWLSNASIQQRERREQGEGIYLYLVGQKTVLNNKCMTWGTNLEILKIKVHLAI